MRALTRQPDRASQFRSRRANRASLGVLAFASLTLASVAMGSAPSPVWANEPAAVASQAAAPASAQAAALAARLPAKSTVIREMTIGGKTMRFASTAGSIPLRDNAGALQAEVAYIAYVRVPEKADGKAGDQANDAGMSAARRPITFVFNGGPGASSAWLNFGGLGPRILSFGNQGDTPSSPPLLRDNPDSWLAFTDLVFIDPPGTGFSLVDMSKEALRKQFLSVDGDIQGLARVVSRYLVENGRLTSPKYLVGESYGGFRAPKLAAALQTGEGIGVNGVIMLSPVLDFARLGVQADAVIGYAALLPSMAAAHLEREGKLTPEALKEVEDYARGAFITDLLRGPRDAEAQERIIARVAEYTGLDRALVARLGGRVDPRTYAREVRQKQGAVVSQYDVNVGSPNPWPFNRDGRNNDPILDGAQAPLSSAAVDEITRVLGWKPEGRYYLLNDQVNRSWDWGRGLRSPEALSDLREALALDPEMKALVAHGYNDLVTPYFQSALDLATLPALGAPKGAAQTLERAPLRAYPGGHMFYTRQSSRDAFLKDVRSMYPAP